MDIWSLPTIDQHKVDREMFMYEPKASERKLQGAKTMNNWLQVFYVLDCIMGHKHPQQCSKLFIHTDYIYNAYKAHGGAAGWRYNEEFGRRLELQPDIRWGVKAANLWLCLMTAQKAIPLSSTLQKPQGTVVVRCPGACWLYNKGNCRFAGSCK